MKVLFISDIHGLDSWKEPARHALAAGTHIVFIGDYVDSFKWSGDIVLDNLKDIISFKKLHPKKVTLLLGNHDYAYVFGFVNISGFNSMYWNNYRQLFNDNWNLFDLAWGFQGEETYTLATHAGLTDWYYKELVKHIENPEHVLYDVIFKEYGESWKDLPLHYFLNYLKDQGELLWKIGTRRFGSSKTGSIIWADKAELKDDNYKGINQIVGHTHINYIEQRSIKNKLFNNYDTLYFIDASKEEQLFCLMLDLK